MAVACYGGKAQRGLARAHGPRLQVCCSDVVEAFRASTPAYVDIMVAVPMERNRTWLRVPQADAGVSAPQRPPSSCRRRDSVCCICRRAWAFKPCWS